MVLVALFVFSFIGIATLSAEEGNVKGTVMSINAETGEMVVKTDADETKTLMADPKSGVDLKSLKEGDKVSVESADGKITTLELAQ
jgi:translation elongation factor P/translation initiation factor 5A